MYIDKYWGNYIGGSDDSLNLVAFLVDQGKEEIPLNEIFSKIGLDRQNWDFHQTMEYLEFTHSDGVEMDLRWTSISPSMWSPIWPPSCWSAASAAV